MSVNQATFPFAAMARVLGVLEAGYHVRQTFRFDACRHRLPSARALADAMLLKRVRTIHASSRATYGAPRVRAARNRLWSADMTFVPTAAGFLHLAVVSGDWSRKPDAERP